MIESFKHKGLQEVFEKGKSAKLPQEQISKLRKLLFVLDNAAELRDLQQPAYRLHKLKKPPLNGQYSIDVTGNYRLVFKFIEGNVYELDYRDTH